MVMVSEIFICRSHFSGSVGVALVPESAATVRRDKLAFRQLHGRHTAAELHVALPADGANAATGMFATITAQACARRGD